MSLFIKAIKYVGALYLPGRHLFKVSRCPQQTVFSISLTEFPFKINNLRALQNNGYPASNSSIFRFAADIEHSKLILNNLYKIGATLDHISNF